MSDGFELVEVEELPELDGMAVTIVRAGTDGLRLQDEAGIDYAVMACPACGVLGSPHINIYRVTDPSVFSEDDATAS